MKSVTFLIALLIAFQFKVFAGKEPKLSSEQTCLDIHHYWLKEAFVLTKNCVGFSAPVSGRAYGYFSVGMYESTVEIIPELQSVSGQLNGFERKVWARNVEELNWTLVVNSADYALLKYFYRNMPPSNEKKMTVAHDSIQKIVSKGFSGKINKQSVEYGKRIAQEIIDWSVSDGADNAFNENYPESFEPPQCRSCWTKTTPGYLPSLLPYWGQNRQFLKESHFVAEECKVFEFSTDKSSLMYEEALKVWQNAKESDPGFEVIAEYWDDAPGYSGTPTGHFFTIASQLAIERELALEKAMELYLKLGVAVNEAFISSFRLKYKYNFIRPITYIHRYIDPQFNTRIASPSFPEFPSGHSFQSGAASEVMKSIFSDTISFTDSTNVGRSDIDCTPRSFNSFTELSEEISISRLYGGIHFQRTLDESLLYGRKIGVYVTENLKCRK